MTEDQLKRRIENDPACSDPGCSYRSEVERRTIEAEQQTEQLRQDVEPVLRAAEELLYEISRYGQEKYLSTRRRDLASAVAALRRQHPKEDDCEHEWIDARNEAVKSGSFCRKCGALSEHPKED